MRAFWDSAEFLDRTLFKALDRIDQLRGSKPLRQRTAEAVKDVREPQRVITFQK